MDGYEQIISHYFLCIYINLIHRNGVFYLIFITFIFILLCFLKLILNAFFLLLFTIFSIQVHLTFEGQ